MKRFRFPLRPVAVMRAHHELAAREALAAALALQRQADERVDSARARLAGLETDILSAQGGSFRASLAVTARQAYRRELAAEAEAQKQAGAARAAMEKRREACVEANRQLKLIGRMEEKARLRYREETQRAEQAELDEIAVRRAARRRAPTP